MKDANSVAGFSQSLQLPVRLNDVTAEAWLGSISAALPCLVYPPWVRGRSEGSFPEQRLVIEPKGWPNCFFRDEFRQDSGHLRGVPKSKFFGVAFFKFSCHFYSQRSLMKIYVETCENSSKKIQSFSNNVFHCHVYHHVWKSRSWTTLKFVVLFILLVYFV